MDKITILERLKEWIATIGWNLFIWGNDFTEEEYWQRIYKQEKAYLETSKGTSKPSESGLHISCVGGILPASKCNCEKCTGLQSIESIYDEY